MAIVILLLAGFLIFAVAAVTIGRVAATGARTARQAVFDLDEAVDFVADRLPYELQARLSHDDVRAVLAWYLDELEAERVAYERDELRLPDDDPIDDDADPIPATIVLDEQNLAARVIGRAETAGLGLSDVDVLLVLEESEHYLEAIGAVGGEAEP
jgi:hypothetical protein